MVFCQAVIYVGFVKKKQFRSGGVAKKTEQIAASGN